MREIFLPLGLSDELRAPLFVDDTCWGYLHLFRAGAFDAAALAYVEAVIPAIAAALRSAVAAPAPDAASAAVATVDRAGNVRGDLAALFPADVAASAARVAALRGRGQAHHRGLTGWLAINALPVGDESAVVVTSARRSDLAPLLFCAHALTKRERDVAALLAAGHSNASIAGELGITVFTAKDHVKAIFAKTRTADRADFARRFA